MAAAAALNVLAFLFSLQLASLVCSLSFNHSHITQADANKCIKVEGDASITTQGIQLIPSECESGLNEKFGGARSVDPLQLWDKATGKLADFTTHFSFNLNSNDDDGGYAGDDDYYAYRLAFFLAKFSTPFNITLLNETQPTSPDPFFAVVFTTFLDHQDNQPKTNVSININPMLQPVTPQTWLNNHCIITDDEEMPNNVSITYNATSRILQVGFTGIWNDQCCLTDNLSSKVDLNMYLPENVSVGFAATTRGCFDNNNVESWQFDSTPLMSNNVSSPAPSPSQNHPPKDTCKRKKGVVIAGLSVVGVLILLALFSIAIYACFKKTGAAKGNNNQIILGPAMEGEFERAGYGPKNFSYSELASATNNFAEEHKLGEGGFGGVYSGFLRELSLDVAVKRVSSQSKQGIEEYATEVKIISQLRHRNLVPLHGWCHENGELLLVYEYMPGGSLDFHLFKRQTPLNWMLRYRIARGLASALSYLHEEWEQCVLHRDIKSSNVLLDSSFNARLGDFGLAWPVDHEETAEKTYLGGTPGYVAPECHFTFKTSKESDVYSFGVVALEIACGRKAILANKQEGRKSLVDWVWDLYGMGRLLEAADPKLSGNFEEQEMERLMIIGLWCAHPDKKSRPNITQVVHCLKFQVQLPILPAKLPKPVYSTFPTALSFPASNSSRIRAFDIQELEYPSCYTRNTRFISSSASEGSSLPPHTC